MRKISGKHLLCFFLLAFPLSWAEDLKKDARDNASDTGQGGFFIQALGWNQVKTRRLFARRKITSPQESHIPKNKSSTVTPARRCSRLMESCSSHAPCCDPCASCRCRLFNTICHCWRMNPLCLNKT